MCGFFSRARDLHGLHSMVRNFSSKADQGQFYESRAADYLCSLGYQIYARNYRSRFGEIDLIAGRQATLAFVEVRQRKQGALVSPALSLTTLKQRNLRATAQAYLYQYPLLHTRFDELRFDLIAVHGDGNMQHVCGIF